MSDCRALVLIVVIRYHNFMINSCIVQVISSYSNKLHLYESIFSSFTYFKYLLPPVLNSVSIDVRKGLGTTLMINCTIRIQTIHLYRQQNTEGLPVREKITSPHDIHLFKFIWHVKYIRFRSAVLDFFRRCPHLLHVLHLCSCHTLAFSVELLTWPLIILFHVVNELILMYFLS